MQGPSIEKMPFGTKIVKYHPSSNRLFSKGNLLEKVILKSSRKLFDLHLAWNDSLKKSNLKPFTKIANYSLFGLSSFSSLVFSSSLLASAFTLETALRTSETFTRFIGKTLDVPGKLIEKKKPTSWLGQLHNYSSTALSDFSSWSNKHSAVRLAKDLSVVALSLGLSYGALTTNYSKQLDNISSSIESIMPSRSDLLNDKNQEIKLNDCPWNLTYLTRNDLKEYQK